MSHVDLCETDGTREPRILAIHLPPRRFAGTLISIRPFVHRGCGNGVTAAAGTGEEVVGDEGGGKGASRTLASHETRLHYGRASCIRRAGDEFPRCTHDWPAMHREFPTFGRGYRCSSYRTLPGQCREYVPPNASGPFLSRANDCP